MRRLLLLVVPLAALAVTATATGGRDAGAASCPTVTDGKLTIGTDNPAYPPWYGGDEGHGWKITDPYSGKGYESAVAYAVAKQLGYPKAKVKWIYTPFNKSFAPGKKSFDFDINQISYRPRAPRSSTFSNSYYDVNQAIVVLKGSKIARSGRSRRCTTTSSASRSGRRATARSSTRSSRPRSAAVYDTNDNAVSALKTKQIDGLVVDLPTAFYVTAVQVPKGKILGQLPAKPGGEHFGMVLQKGNPLLGCVNSALGEAQGQRHAEADPVEWLSKAPALPS